jgi:hypothetical protein
MGQPPPGQENGVTGTGQQFGPARGEYHDTNQWAMTVSKATTREIVNDPPPTDRQRKPGEPAFLRPSQRPGSENLAALLTIYHSIPLAREALLLPNYQQFNYGYERQWWTGHHIEAPKIVSLDEHGAHHNRDDVLIETQRLMAFLDDTNRAYASIDALADLPSYHEKEAESELSRFLEAWNDGAMIRSLDDPLTQVFTSHGIRHDPDNTSNKYFFCLEPMVDPEIDQTFTDILDSIIWSDQSLNQFLSNVWIDDVGDIMTFRLCDPKRKQGKLGVEIPAIWYPDRYMEHFREASREMRVRRRKLLEELWRLERLEHNILRCMPAGPQGMLDIKKVLSVAAERAPLVINNQRQQGPMTETMSSPHLSSAEVKDCVNALQDLVASIDKKIASFERERQDLRTKLRNKTAELTEPNAEELSSPSHRYTLRGVSTKQHITYVLQQAAEALQDPEAESSVSMQWQWWRISSSTEKPGQETSAVQGPNPKPPPSSEQAAVSFGVSGPFSPWPPTKTHNNPSSSEHNGNIVSYTVCRVSEADVLKAAREEGDSIMLVYASDKAVNFRGTALSRPLQTFVKADNKIFESELRGIEQEQGPDDVTDGEEMAQLHFSNLDGMQDVPLINDSDETMYGERRSSPPATVALPARRGADGQPSPKRAKGEEEPPPYHNHNRNVPEMQERSSGMGILGTVQPNNNGQNAGIMMDRVREDTGPDEKEEAKHLERFSSV